jgi:lipoprotein-anchoring transpeptidase ErfK/SrfK
MNSRYLAALVFAAATIGAVSADAAPTRPARPATPVAATPASTPSPNMTPMLDPDGRYTGGRPNSLLGIFGGTSPIARTTVSFTGNHEPGTIIVNTTERRLYYVLGNGQALRYGIGVGRDGFRWQGNTRVSQKKEWPSWTPPSQMLARRPDLPRFMPGGPNNPLGARAMYLGSSLYRIHGSNEPETIGQAVSSGCFRLTNEDVIDLYNRVKVGAKVIVLR